MTDLTRNTGNARSSVDDLPVVPTPAFMLAAARRFWHIMLLAAVVGGVVAGAYAAQRPAEYQATASIYFSNTSTTDRITGVGGGSSDPDRRAATQIELIKLPTVASRAARQIGGDWNSNRVRQSFTVTQGGQSDLVEITATAPSGPDATVLANAVADAAISYRADSDREDARRALAVVQRQLDEMSGAERSTAVGQTLLANRSRLELEVASPGGDAEVAERARDAFKVSAPVWRTVILGMLLGLAIGFGVALVRSRVDPRLTTKRQLLSIWQAPVLASLPRDRRLAAGAFEHAASPSLAPLLIARTSLRYMSEGQPFAVVGVTSAIAGEGKSTVSWGLAAAAAAEGDRVLLIEADLRAPRLSETRGTRRSPGVLGFLQGRMHLEDVVVGSGERSALTFDVVPAGGTPPAPVPLLRSGAFAELIAAARAAYDLVIVDLPPVTLVPDALTVGPHLDGYVSIVRMGHVAPGSVARERDLLSDTAADGTPVIGLVVNDQHSRETSEYGYGAAYGTATGAA